jgi:hypothetical protein
MFYNVTICRLVELHRRFGGKYSLNHKDRKVRQGSNQQEQSNKDSLADALWTTVRTNQKRRALGVWDTE